MKKHPLIFRFGLTSYMLFAFLLVEIHILLPSYVHDFLEEKGDIYASAEVYYSLGAILAGFFGKNIGEKFSEIITSVAVSISALLSFVVFFKVLTNAQECAKWRQTFSKF